MKVLWVVVAVFSVFGGLALFFTIVGANGAPQEAAGSAMAVALAVIPYCFTRALAELHRS